MKLDVSHSRIVSLPALMCKESCIMTGLNMAGYNYKLMLLEAWNLLYEGGVLIGSKRLSKFDLGFIYGIQTGEVTGNVGKLIQLIENNGLVLVSVRESKLKFTRNHEIEFDSVGFTHQILVYSYDSESELFEIIDPVSDYMGSISILELQAAATVHGLFKLWYMDLFEIKSAASIDEIYRRAAVTNFSRFEKNKLALLQMKEDLLKTPELPLKERELWFKRNALTISTIAKIRQNIWITFSESDSLTKEQKMKGLALIDSIGKGWISFKFQLMKVMIHPLDFELLNSIEQRIESLIHLEYEFLKHIYYQWGK
ncbi:hypothetical protein D7Z26_13845 [Cohnella endophytica]|uniref:Butirosin biosynthesis protein H N-terminal domain-containing protein n=1 Tax=Cohnella endophytica TaxID=2419778 RepID=A0A494XZG5_9BACL|nr:hypothetical protein [Cohnella endophytica]RKP54429.1 hypothetical protein D7Z26_13845 [Cohnella endophytica]